MMEDMNTKDLNDRELLELLRRDLVSMHQDFNARLEQMDGRLGTLEARTNPLPPNYDARFTALERDVKEIKREMRQLRDHDWQREGQLMEVRERLEALESRATT
jgi:predicted  nucleic acid-binding Zn-ribbon protein